MTEKQDEQIRWLISMMNECRLKALESKDGKSELAGPAQFWDDMRLLLDDVCRPAWCVK